MSPNTLLRSALATRSFSVTMHLEAAKTRPLMTRMWPLDLETLPLVLKGIDDFASEPAVLGEGPVGVLRGDQD